MDFYEELVETYDTMTRFQERLQKEGQVFKKLLQRYSMRKVLDAACGTGFYAILLDILGREVVGADVSEAMVCQAEKNADQYQALITFVQCSFQELSQKVHEKFDTVLCLGNSLPHLLTWDDLKLSLQNFNQCLVPHGILILQNLNYDRILNRRQRIVGVTQNDRLTFVRFYDFLEERIQFNILEIERNDQGLHHKLISTQLYPWRREELLKALEQTGFGQIEIFGNLELQPFDSATSKNIVTIARKNNLEENQDDA